VGAVGLEATGKVVTASRLGLIQQLPLESLRRCQRGDIGQIGVRFEQRGDQLVGISSNDYSLLGVVLSDERNLRIDTNALNAKKALGLSLENKLVKLVPLSKMEE